MPNMTRAEAVTACTNILDLIESMDDRLPEDFARGLNDRARSMKERITQNSQFSHITEGMDKALRNMWGALRKWDRKDEHNDELFYGLDETIRELAEFDEDDKDFSVSEEGDTAPSSAAKDPMTVGTADKRPAKLRKALEMEFDFQKEALENPAFLKRQADAEEAQRAYKARNDAEREQSSAQSKARNEKRKAQTAPPSGDVQHRGAPKPETKNAAPVITPEDVARARETAVSVVLNQAHSKTIRVVESSTIQHGDLGDVLSKTSSDRTQQLILAAFYCGKVAGTRMLADDILAILKRAGKE